MNIAFWNSQSSASSATGQWSFSNVQGGGLVFTMMDINGSPFGSTLSPDPFPLSFTQAGSFTAPVGFTITALNTFTVTSTAGSAGTVAILKESDPLQFYPVNLSGTTTINNFAMNASDDIFIQLGEPPVAYTGTFTATNNIVGDVFLSCTMNGTNIVGLSPNDFPLNSGQSGSLASPVGVQRYSINYLSVSTTAGIAGTINVSINAVPTLTVPINLSGTTLVHNLFVAASDNILVAIN